MAAGIVALALEVNPELNWRDVQHLTVRTSRPRGKLEARDWSDNGVGLSFSHSFGFGLMDAGAMVKLAKRWKTVPEQKICAIKVGLIINCQTKTQGFGFVSVVFNGVLRHPCN